MSGLDYDLDAELWDDTPEMDQVIEASIQIDESISPPPSPRKLQIHDRAPSKLSRFNVSPETPSRYFEEMAISDSPTPSTTSLPSYRDGRLSPTPTRRRIPATSGSRFLTTAKGRAFVSSSSETEEEEEESLSQTQTSISSIFSSVSRASSETSVSSNKSSLRISRKPTLEYGDSSSMASIKRSTTSDHFDHSVSSAKLRKTQSASIPQPAFTDDVFSTRSSASAPSNNQPRRTNDSLILGAHPISHCHQAQNHIDRQKIAWGVQYEIARGVTRGLWSWEDVTPEKLRALRGSNAEAAPKVPSLFLELHGKPSGDLRVWEELDREQLAIVEASDCERGLGVYGDFEHETDWHGGRVLQIARLVPSQSPDADTPYRIQLEVPEYQKASTRFARFLGSRRMLRLSINPDLIYREEEQIRQFLTQKFVLCGRTFRPLKPKDGKVYMVEVSEDFDRVPRDDEGDHRRLTFEQIIEWHNPMEFNLNQPTRKYVSRFDLGFSVSVPVLEFKTVDIYYTEDSYVPSYHRDQGKASAEQTLTDGCGFMNRGALAAIAKHINLEHIPTAVQGRIAGSKGLWLLHPEYQHDPSETPMIWIRESQYKINIPDNQMTRAHRIFDLVAPNRLTFPSRLSSQTIVNLSHNGVPDEIFVKLMKDGIKEDFNKLTTWDSENAMKVVLHAVGKVGNVNGIRVQREAAGMGRALGYGHDKDVEDSFEPSGSDENVVPPPPGRARVSLEPNTLGEKVYEMIAAGFEPLQSQTLNADLKQLVKNVLQGYVKSYHIPNPQSCDAFIVPDPFDILEENQIYFRSWSNVRDAQSECNPEMVTGPALINRNPTRLPSDVQLVTAVDGHHDVYQNYRNVIICSTKGDRSLASKLAGGDYDGDTATLTWMPEIVSAFRPPEFSDPPERFMEQNFQKEVETVDHFQKRLARLPRAIQQQQLQQIFLLGLGDTKVGLYSRFHDNSTYKLGYGHPETIRLAYMFTTVLDASKTGLRVEPQILTVDNSKWNRPLPACMAKTEVSSSGSNSLPPFKRQIKGCFVLDVLCHHGDKIYDSYLAKYEGISVGLRETMDQDISSMFLGTKSKWRNMAGAQAVFNELLCIEAHVESVLQAWLAIWPQHCASPQKATVSSTKSSKKKSRRDIDRALNEVRNLYASDIEGVIILPVCRAMFDQLKASCAHAKKEKFANAVAFRDVCALKASAKGLAPVTRQFSDILSVPLSFTRIWAQA